MLIEVIAALLEGARQAARLLVDGESTRKGPRPAWLEAASDIDVTGLTPGSAALSLEAPTLADAAPERFGGLQQLSLFGEEKKPIRSDVSVLDLMGVVLASAVKGDPDQTTADRSLLDTFARLGRSFGGRFDALRLDGFAGLDGPLVLGVKEVEKIERLRDSTPVPKVARLAGTLDTISATRPVMVLRLSDGTSATARSHIHDIEQLKSLLGQKVVVTGVAHFRPSGKLWAIDVDTLEPARGDSDALFERAPIGVVGPPGAHQPGESAPGVSAFFGTWPGDESDDELAEAVEAIR